MVIKKTLLRMQKGLFLFRQNMFKIYSAIGALVSSTGGVTSSMMASGASTAVAAGVSVSTTGAVATSSVGA
jgi:hypothetical protein